MNINFKFLLCGAAFCFVPQAAVAQCAVTDCQQLGYTSLKSCTGGLKCPFGEYWACPKVEEKAVLGECTGYAKNCKIGDILNSDGTCSNDKVSGKTPIGVVVYISGGNCGQAMTVNPIENHSGISAWGNEYVDTGVMQSDNWQIIIKDYDSCGNTRKITQAGDSSKYPAAWMAVSYAPVSVPETKGKWCLPAAGVWNSVYNNLNSVNIAISKMGGRQLVNDNEHIWSSSEYLKNYAWQFCTDKSDASSISSREGGISWSRKGNSGYVRPVIAF